MEKITRKEALAKGLKFYFTGNPCCRKHITKRYVGNSTCYQCVRELQNILQKGRDRTSANLTLKQIKTRSVESVRQNLKRLKRVPSWSEKEQIKEFYRNCPIGFEFDHIYPLQGKNVSGLHVLGNLQYLPIAVNRSKSNKFIGD